MIQAVNLKSFANSLCIFWLALIYFNSDATANEPTRYLAFQIFTGSTDSADLQHAFPPSSGNLRRIVTDLRDRVGVAQHGDRSLGFLVGPIALDNTDDDARKLIQTAFDVALETGVAVGFHVDDSMFWGRLKRLNTPENIEWLDWRGTPNTGRRLDWSEKPMKIAPQLCVNSPAVKEAVAARALLIGEEIAKGVQKLHATNKDGLFVGVIAGWEMQIGRDFETGRYLGYCALTNAGYSEKNQPPDMDAALSKITLDFGSFWSRSLTNAGVPPGKVYSHIAYMSAAMYGIAKVANPAAAAAPYLQNINYTPPAVAFCDGCIPGLSTYPQPGHLEQWQDELKKHGNPPWASCEGTAIDPGEAERTAKGVDMEGYLGNLFNHGAVLVNIMGWGVGEAGNPFRNTTENENALAAYRKFLSGATLREAPISIPSVPPSGLFAKVHKIQAKMDSWIQTNGPGLVKDNLEKLTKAMQSNDFATAEQAADAVLAVMGP